MKLTICETDIVHGFLFTKDQGQKAKEPNIREVKYWKGDQPKLMQSNNGEKLIIYLPRLWKTLGQVCKICIVHPDFQLLRQIYFLRLIYSLVCSNMHGMAIYH